MNIILGILIFSLWCIIGLILLRRDPHAGGGIAMVTHNAPVLGIAMLLLHIIFWPIVTPMMIALIWVIEKLGIK